MALIKTCRVLPVLALLSLTCVGGSLHAATAPCDSRHSHEFDFWAGDWHNEETGFRRPAPIAALRNSARVGPFAHSILPASRNATRLAFWSMVPDAVEANEHIFGDRYEAKTISLAMFSPKFTLAINALLIGSVLELTGYSPTGPVTPETISGLRALIAFVPLTCIVISVVALWNYRLDATEHQRLRELNAQRLD